MNITFNKLREVKHSLPTGSVKRIADELNVSEQTVRNYFGAEKYSDATRPIDKHVQPGPNGGIVNLSDTRIFEAAMRIVAEREGTNN